MGRGRSRGRRIREVSPLAVTLTRVYFVLHALGLLAVIGLVALMLGVFKLADVEAPSPEYAGNVRIVTLLGFWLVVLHSISLAAYLLGATSSRTTGGWVYRLVLLAAAPISGLFALGWLGLALTTACAVPLLCFWCTRDVRGWHGVGRARTGLRSVLARRVLRGD